MSTPKKAERYHLRILEDKVRRTPGGKPITPVGSIQVGPVVAHAMTARTVGDKVSFVQGQTLRLTEEEVAAIKQALAVTDRPIQVLARVERRMIDTPEGVVEREVKVFREAPHGRGPVVQWLPETIERSAFSDERVEWSARVIDRSDPRYEPLADPANEVPLAAYVSLLPAPQDEEAPPPIDLTGVRAKADDEVEAKAFTPKVPDPLGVRAEVVAAEAAPHPPAKRKG